jgi:hypothetical protein
MAEPQSVLVELADGIAAALNAQTFSMAFEADRDWAFRVDPEELVVPTVCVVPEAKVVTNVSRAVKSTTATIDVSLRRRHGGGPGDMAPREKCDQLAALAEEIEDFLADPKNKVLTANLKAVPTGAEVTFVREDLISERCVTLVITVSYQLFR